MAQRTGTEQDFAPAGAIVTDQLTRGVLTPGACHTKIQVLRQHGGQDAALTDYLAWVLRQWCDAETAKTAYWLERGV
jgi:hypothetical protein